MKKIDASTWLFVLVQDPEGAAQIVGQEDIERNLAFVPAFLDRDDAQQGALSLPRPKGIKIEIQAIIFEDLSGYATRKQLAILVLDGQGKVLQQL